MKTPTRTIYLVAALLLSVAFQGFGDDSPERRSIAPTNDLSTLICYFPNGGSIVASGFKSSKEFQSGYSIGATNAILGFYNILIIDDGRLTFDAVDKESGLPIVVLTDAKPTRELHDLIQGYNSAMNQLRTKLHKNQSSPNKRVQATGVPPVPDP